MAHPPAGTVAFLFTDIEGSTRLLEQLGDRYLQVLALHHRLFRAAFHDAHGHEMDAQGDVLFAVFPCAKDALLAAVAMQRALAAQPWPGGITLRVRMGLHTGEPLSGETGDAPLGLGGRPGHDAGAGDRVRAGDRNRTVMVC